MFLTVSDKMSTTSNTPHRHTYTTSNVLVQNLMNHFQLQLHLQIVIYPSLVRHVVAVVINNQMLNK